MTKPRKEKLIKSESFEPDKPKKAKLDKRQIGIAFSVNSGVIMTGSIVLLAALITTASSHPEYYSPPTTHNTVGLILMACTMGLSICTAIMNSGAIHKSIDIISADDESAYKEVVRFIRISRWLFAFSLLFTELTALWTLFPIK